MGNPDAAFSDVDSQSCYAALDAGSWLILKAKDQCRGSMVDCLPLPPEKVWRKPSEQRNPMKGCKPW